MGLEVALVSVAGICTAYALYYLVWVAHRPKVVGAGNSKLKDKLLKHCPILSECYWPTFWGFQCHLSTILRVFLQKNPNIKYRRELLTLSDGGEVALDWGVPSKSSSSQEGSLGQSDSDPLLLIIPGITGCSYDNYIQHLVEDGLIAGYRPVSFNQRGNGGLKLKTMRIYCASDIGDLFEVVQYLHSKYPLAFIVSIGVSLGGMILTQYLHQLGKECDINVAISISACWDPFISRESLEEKKINKLLYSRVLVNNIKAIVENNSHLRLEEREKLPLNIKGVMEAEVVSEIDRHLTAPLFGFSCLEDYYQASKNSDKLHKIQTPLICITAADDPFVPKESLPFEEIEHNSETVMVVTSYGGHFGFIEGLYPNKKTWMDRAVLQILATFKTR